MATNMSTLGFMRGAVNVGAGFDRLRREVHLDVDDVDSTPNVQIVTPLEEYFSIHRFVKAHVPFSDLDPIYRNDFYDKVAI